MPHLARKFKNKREIGGRENKNGIQKSGLKIEQENQE